MSCSCGQRHVSPLQPSQLRVDASDASRAGTHPRRADSCFQQENTATHRVVTHTARGRVQRPQRMHTYEDGRGGQEPRRIASARSSRVPPSRGRRRRHRAARALVSAKRRRPGRFVAATPRRRPAVQTQARASYLCLASMSEPVCGASSCIKGQGAEQGRRRLPAAVVGMHLMGSLSPRASARCLYKLCTGPRCTHSGVSQ